MQADFLVILTPGRSSSSTHFHLKWASELSNQVFVFAGCRNPVAESKFHEISKNSSVSVADCRSWSGNTRNIVDSMLQEVESDPNITNSTRIVILFAGGKQSIYLQLYQRLKANYDYNVQTITETEIKATTDFTINDWMSSNARDSIEYDTEKNSLNVIGNGFEVALRNLKTGVFENPTRLYAQYVEELTITSEMDMASVRESLGKFKKQIRKNIEKLNLLLIGNNLTTEIRVRPQIKINIPSDCVEIYYDEKFLTRSMYLYLAMNKHPIIKLHGGDFEIERRFMLLRNKLISDKRRRMANTELERLILIKRYLVDVVNANLSRTDSMKWLIREKGNLKINYRNKTLVTDGFNGRELSSYIESSDSLNCEFKEGKDLIQPSEAKTMVSALLISLNAHHYVSLDQKKFDESVKRINRSKIKQRSDDFERAEKISLLGIELRGKNRVPHYTFSINDDKESYACPTSDFCELMYALAKNTQKHNQFFENLWSFDEDKKTIKPHNNLLSLHGISGSNKSHVIDADGYGMLSGLRFEISDVHCTTEYNSERILDKYEKYEKMSSNFPYPIYNTVFTVFNRPTSKDLQMEKNLIIPFLEQGKNRIWKFLDLSKLTPESNIQAEIPLASLGKFLFDLDSEYAKIHNFEEWCYMTKNDNLSLRLECEEE